MESFCTLENHQIGGMKHWEKNQELLKNLIKEYKGIFNGMVRKIPKNVSSGYCLQEVLCKYCIYLFISVLTISLIYSSLLCLGETEYSVGILVLLLLITIVW